jgi:hypothetical protein
MLLGLVDLHEGLVTHSNQTFILIPPIKLSYPFLYSVTSKFLSSLCTFNLQVLTREKKSGSNPSLPPRAQPFGHLRVPLGSNDSSALFLCQLRFSLFILFLFPTPSVFQRRVQHFLGICYFLSHLRSKQKTLMITSL